MAMWPQQRRRTRAAGMPTRGDGSGRPRSAPGTARRAPEPPHGTGARQRFHSHAGEHRAGDRRRDCGDVPAPSRETGRRPRSSRRDQERRPPAGKIRRPKTGSVDHEHAGTGSGQAMATGIRSTGRMRWPVAPKTKQRARQAGRGIPLAGADGSQSGRHNGTRAGEARTGGHHPARIGCKRHAGHGVISSAPASVCVSEERLAGEGEVRGPIAQPNW